MLVVPNTLSKSRVTVFAGSAAYYYSNLFVLILKFDEYSVNILIYLLIRFE